ncbi:uncharacterized protein [Bemisia tabaci]
MDCGLLKQFVAKTTNFDEKCCLGLQIFSLQGVSIPRKEEIVFYWITEGIKNENKNDSEILLLLDVLKDCCLNEQSKSLAYGWLSPSLTNSIIKALSKLFENRPCHAEKYTTLLFSLLENPHFDRYLLSHVEFYVDLMASYINSLLKSEHGAVFELIDFFLNTLHHLTNMKDLTFSKHKFEVESIKRLYIPLVCLYERISLTEKSQKQPIAYERLLNCISQIMFSDYSNSVTLSTHLKKYIESDVEQEDEDHQLSILFKTLKFNAQSTVESGWTLFLTIFIELPEVKKLKISDILDVCIVTSSFIKKPAFDDSTPAISIESYIAVYKNILNILSECQIIGVTSGQISGFSSWLSKLLKHLFKSIDKTTSPEKLKLLNTVFSLYPTCIDDSLHTFVEVIALRQKDDKNIEFLYVQLLEQVLQNFRKSHRIPKFIFQFLMFTTNALSTECNFKMRSVTLQHVLPPAFISKFCVTLGMLQSTSTSAALDKLYFFLDKFVISLQDSQSQIDDNHILLGEILCEVYCCILTGTRLADQNVPEILRQSHQEKINDIARLLSNFGKALLSKKHNQRLMVAFLRLCSIWGEIEILMIRYVDARIRVPKQTDSSPTNLTYIHQYLSDYHWNLIAQRVINFGFDVCKDTLHSLVLQKIQALPLLEDEIEGIYTDGEDKDGPRCIAARYLLNSARFEWLTKNVDTLLPELEPDEVLKFTKTVVRQCLQDSIIRESENMILPLACDDNPQLVFAMALYTFYDCGKKLSKHKVKSTSRILKYCNYEKLIKVEQELTLSHKDHHFQELINNLGSEISLIWKGIINSNDAEFDISFLKGNIELLAALPLNYLSSESRTVLICLIFAVCHDISVAVLKDDINKSTLHLILTLILGLLQNKIHLQKSFEWSGLILWINEISLNYEYHKQLMDTLVGIAVSKQNWITPLVDSIIGLNEKAFVSNEVIPKHAVNLLSNVTNVLSITKLIQVDSDPGSIVFLRTLVIHRKKFREFVTIDFLRKVWKIFLAQLSIEALKDVLDVLFTNELERIMNQSKNFLLSFVKKDPFDSADFQTVINVCMALLKMDCSKLKAQQEHDSKVKCRQGYLCFFVMNLSLKLNSLHQDKYEMTQKDKSVLLEFISQTILTSQIKFDGQILDFCLNTVSYLSKDSSVCTDCIDILFTLLSCRSYIMMDALPAFCQCYLSLYSAISAKSDMNRFICESTVQLLASQAFKVEKLTTQMEKNIREFKRIAPLIIADILLISQRSTIHQLIKAHLMNSTFTLIRMCDKNSINFLNTNLPYSSIELFKKIEQDFEKSFKYSGKI